MVVALPAAPTVLPAYLRPEECAKSRFLLTTKLKCMPVRKTVPVSACVVLQSVPGVDADQIIRGFALLAGMRPSQGTSALAVAHYRLSLHVLVFHFRHTCIQEDHGNGQLPRVGR